MEWLFELFFEIFGELLLQFIFEALAQTGLHLFRRRERQAFSTPLLLFGYGVLGAAAGAISVVLIPHYMLRAHFARIAYLFLGPAALGSAFAAMGAWRAERAAHRANLDRFIHGYAFAFCFALIRFWLASPPG